MGDVYLRRKCDQIKKNLKENKFKATPKLILFYPKINSLTPNEKPPQNYFFYPKNILFFTPKIFFLPQIK